MISNSSEECKTVPNVKCSFFLVCFILTTASCFCVNEKPEAVVSGYVKINLNIFHAESQQSERESRKILYFVVIYILYNISCSFKYLWPKHKK